MSQKDDASVRLEPDAVEVAIEKCVRRFYDGAHADPLLAPVMRSIVDFEKHVSVVCDFWSHVLLGTGRYVGPAYPAHVNLPIRPEHFDRWLALFADAATVELAPVHARLSLEKARHMAQSFVAGMFPFEGLDGRDIRRPQILLETLDRRH